MFSLFSGSSFAEAQEKSMFIHQYKCKCSEKTWWGSDANNVNKRCGAAVGCLDLIKTIGIGWFKCSGGPAYAGKYFTFIYGHK